MRRASSPLGVLPQLGLPSELSDLATLPTSTTAAEQGLDFWLSRAAETNEESDARSRLCCARFFRVSPTPMMAPTSTTTPMMIAARTLGDRKSTRLNSSHVSI